MAWAVHSAMFLINTDGISYISIAKYYANGQFDLAINAWLPPFISWLASPLIMLGLDGQLAFYIVNALLAASVLTLGMFVVWRTTKKKTLPTVIFWAAITPFLVYAVGRFITPDLAILLWLVIFLATLFKCDEILNSTSGKKYLKTGLILGVLGAIGYFVKLFLAFYFLAAIAGWTLIRFISYRDKRKKIFSTDNAREYLSSLVIAVVSMILIISPWLLLLENKYDTFTIGSSFAYNTSSVTDTGETAGLKSLKPPPNEKAVTFLEDVTELAKTTDDSLESDFKNPSTYLSDRIEILPIYVGDIILLSPLIVIAMLSVGAALLYNKMDYEKHKVIMLAALLAFVNFIGYLAAKSPPRPGVTRGVERYNWPLLVLSLIIIAISLPILWSFLKKENLARRSAFILLAIAIPVMTYINFMPSPSRLFGAPRKQTYNALAEQLVEEDLIPPGSKIAGNNSRPLMPTAFFLESQTFGSTGTPAFNSDIVQAELEKYAIDYYFYFSPLDDYIPVDLTGTEGKIISELEFPRFPCLDIRYGLVGEGILPEACHITIIEL